MTAELQNTTAVSLDLSTLLRPTSNHPSPTTSVQDVKYVFRATVRTIAETTKGCNVFRSCRTGFYSTVILTKNKIHAIAYVQ